MLLSMKLVTLLLLLVLVCHLDIR